MAESSKDKFITLEVDFFTSKEPSATPDFCGCIVNTMQGEDTMAPMGLVRDCYVKAIKDGPAPAPQFPLGRVGDEDSINGAKLYFQVSHGTETQDPKLWLNQAK